MGGCGDEPRAFVAVDLVTDVAPGELADVRTALLGAAGGERARVVSSEELTGKQPPWRVAEFGDLAPGSYRIRMAFRDAAGVELLHRTVAFRVSGRRIIRVVITRSCLDVSCPAAGEAPERTECLGGSCVEPTCVEGDESGCGVPQCTADAQCRPDSNSCLGTCVGGACLGLPADDACPSGQVCGSAGQCVRPGDGGVSDAGLGEDAGADAAMDAGAPDPCPDGCDDGNPCTADRCTEAGCVFESAPRDGERCDDGVYCNGEDRCMNGSCSVHAGDPCIGGTRCDEAGARCVGCREDGDCPAPMVGPWSDCIASGGSGDDFCGGTRERTVTSYRCDVTAGVCVGVDSTETEPCTANEGGTCGSTSCGAWSTCGGFSSTCDQTGTQSRTCTDYVCGGGVCGSQSRTETRACTRSTNGLSCDDGNYCNGTETCSSGSCVSSGNPCPPSAPICIESTNRCVECTSDAHCGGATPYCVGNKCVACRATSDCPASSCGAWGACGGFSSTCDQTGTQSRTCTDYACVSNVCQSSTRTETQNCMRITECQSCAPGSICLGGICRSGAFCP